MSDTHKPTKPRPRYVLVRFDNNETIHIKNEDIDNHADGDPVKYLSYLLVDSAPHEISAKDGDTIFELKPIARVELAVAKIKSL